MQTAAGSRERSPGEPVPACRRRYPPRHCAMPSTDGYGLATVEVSGSSCPSVRRGVEFAPVERDQLADWDMTRRYSRSHAAGRLSRGE